MVPPKYEVTVAKPLGCVMEETDGGFVRIQTIKDGSNAAGMLTHADVCWRMLTYADVWRKAPP